MKTVIVYRSKSGFTKSYVNHLTEELECDVLENKHLSMEHIIDYDTIIYGAGLYISGINGIEVITKNFEDLKDKNLIVFFVGATPGRDSEIEEVISKNFNETQRQSIQFFYLRGGFDFKRLTLIDKILMILLKLKLKLKRNKTNDEIGMLNAYSKPVDFTSKHKVKTLVEYVRTLEHN